MKQDIIIGIAGTLNSGKDTAASMINYIYYKFDNHSYADYISDILKYDSILKYTNIHFADNLKKVLSIMFNIDINYFYDRDFKDNYYYVFSEREFIKELNNYKEITSDDLKIMPLSCYIVKPDACIKLRTLLQYFGTDISRRYLNNKIWIDSTINNAKDILKKYNYCIISDVRFANEAAAIRYENKGIVIGLQRNNSNDNHESEKIDFECDYYIDNNSTLIHLFTEIYKIIKNL